MCDTCHCDCLLHITFLIKDFQLKTDFPSQFSVFLLLNHLALLKDRFLKKMLLQWAKTCRLFLQNYRLFYSNWKQFQFFKIEKFEFKVTVHYGLSAICTQLWPLMIACKRYDALANSVLNWYLLYVCMVDVIPSGPGVLPFVTNLLIFKISKELVGIWHKEYLDGAQTLYPKYQRRQVHFCRAEFNVATPTDLRDRCIHVQRTVIHKQNSFWITSRGVQRWTSTDFRLKYFLHKILGIFEFFYL